MMTKVEQQIASAKETRFRFLSPGKLVGKLRKSTDKSLILSYEREVRTPRPLHLAQSTRLQNPLNESGNYEVDSTEGSGEDQECIILRKIQNRGKESRNRRNLTKNQFFRSL